MCPTTAVPQVPWNSGPRSSDRAPSAGHSGSRSLSRSKWVPNAIPIIIRANDVRQRRDSPEAHSSRPSRSASPALPSGACCRSACSHAAMDAVPAWAIGPAKTVSSTATASSSQMVTRSPSLPVASLPRRARTSSPRAEVPASRCAPAAERARSPQHSLASARQGRALARPGYVVRSAPGLLAAAAPPKSSGAGEALPPPAVAIPFSSGAAVSTPTTGQTPTTGDRGTAVGESHSAGDADQQGTCGQPVCDPTVGTRRISVPDFVCRPHCRQFGEVDLERLGFGETPGWKMPAISPCRSTGRSPRSPTGRSPRSPTPPFRLASPTVWARKEPWRLQRDSKTAVRALADVLEDELEKTEEAEASEAQQAAQLKTGHDDTNVDADSHAGRDLAAAQLQATVGEHPDSAVLHGRVNMITSPVVGPPAGRDDHDVAEPPPASSSASSGARTPRCPRPAGGAPSAGLVRGRVWQAASSAGVGAASNKRSGAAAGSPSRRRLGASRTPSPSASTMPGRHSGAGAASTTASPVARAASAYSAQTATSARQCDRRTALSVARESPSRAPLKKTAGQVAGLRRRRAAFAGA